MCRFFPALEETPEFTCSNHLEKRGSRKSVPKLSPKCIKLWVKSLVTMTKGSKLSPPGPFWAQNTNMMLPFEVLLGQEGKNGPESQTSGDCPQPYPPLLKAELLTFWVSLSGCVGQTWLAPYFSIGGTLGEQKGHLESRWVVFFCWCSGPIHCTHAYASAYATPPRLQGAPTRARLSLVAPTRTPTQENRA